MEVTPQFKSIVESSWAFLTKPVNVPEQGLPELKELNFFSFNKGFLERRKEIIKNVYEAVLNISKDERVKNKIISSRYTAGLQSILVLKQLRQCLGEYVSALEVPV